MIGKALISCRVVSPNHAAATLTASPAAAALPAAEQAPRSAALEAQLRPPWKPDHTAPPTADCSTLGRVTNKTETAILHTNYGDISIDLFGNHAPKTVENFVGLANGTKEYSQPNAQGSNEGPFYDGAIFHRIIDGFMIQGGDPTGTGRGGPGYQFEDEFHPELQFDRPFLLAMANAGPSTNGSQFFITVTATPHLNNRHTIFGEVTDKESQKVVAKISRVATDRMDRPNDDVVIESVEITK